MKRLERSKLFVFGYTIETKRETFILADNIEDAIKEHRATFPSFHRNLKYVQFVSSAPFITEKISKRDFVSVQDNESPEMGEKALLERLELQSEQPQEES